MLAERVRSPLSHVSAVHRPSQYLISRRSLQRALGGLWLIDGLLQLQPSMFTSHLVTDIMQPATAGQPGLVAASLQPMIHITQAFLIPVNATIALIQLALGIGLLGGRLVRPAVLASIVWSLLIWYGGEGLGMLLTGQAGVLTGAPGPVLLYALLAAVACPAARADKDGAMPRQHLRWFLAGFWALAGVLQLQPWWWQPGQVSRTIDANESPGTLNGTILDGSLRQLAHVTAGWEVPLNVAIIVLALALVLGLVVLPPDRIRPVLLVSTVLSVLVWWAGEGCGLLLTGASTDVNSGPLLILLALACWPARRSAQVTPATSGYRADIVAERVPRGLEGGKMVPDPAAANPIQ